MNDACGLERGSLLASMAEEEAIATFRCHGRNPDFLALLRGRDHAGSCRIAVEVAEDESSLAHSVLERIPVGRRGLIRSIVLD